MDKPTTYKIVRPRFTRHYDITSPRQLYVDVSAITPGKPDLTIHNGDSDKAPIIAVSHFTKFSRQMKLGLGDPANPSSMIWEDLNREGLSAAEHGFAFTLPSGERKTFFWRRTHHHAVDGSNSSLIGSRNFKLVEESSKDIVAVFTTGSAFSRESALQINVAYGEEFELFLLAGALSLYEKVKRRRGRAAAIGGAASA